MSLLLGVTQSQTVFPERGRLDVVADSQHIHIIVAAVRGVGREIEVLVHYVLDGRPDRAYVSGNSPRITDTADPGTRIVPSADVHLYRSSGHAVDDLPDAGVAFLHVHTQVTAAAVVNLYEIEIPLVEIPFGVLNLVLPQSGSQAVEVVVVARTAGVVAGIGIYAGLQTFGVDVVHKFTHTCAAFREALSVRHHKAGGVTLSEEAVVDVYKVVAGFQKTLLQHQVGLMSQDGVGNIHHIGVP